MWKQKAARAPLAKCNIHKERKRHTIVGSLNWTKFIPSAGSLPSANKNHRWRRRRSGRALLPQGGRQSAKMQIDRHDEGDGSLGTVKSGPGAF